MRPHLDVSIRLPRDLTPDQATALLDALEAVHQAVWDAYEDGIVARILEEYDAPSPPADSLEDEEIPY